MTTLPAVVRIVDLPVATTVTGGELVEAIQTVGGTSISVQMPISSIMSTGFGALPAGGATGQLLAKLSGTNYSATWSSVVSFVSVNTASALATSGTATSVVIGIPAGGITSTQIANNAVGTNQLASSLGIASSLSVGTLLTVGGTATFNGTAIFNNTTIFNGTVTFAGGLQVAGTTLITGTFGVVGTATFTGVHNVIGTTIFTSGTFGVVGTTLMTGLFGVSGTANFTGVHSVVGTTLFTSGAFGIVGTTILTGTFTQVGTSTMTGTNNLNGPLNVIGTSTITGVFSVNGTTLFTSGTFGVVGTTLYTGVVGIVGTTNFTGVHNIAGTTNITGLVTLSTYTAGVLVSSSTGVISNQGGMVLLNTLTPNGVASSNDTTSFGSAYRNFLFTFENVTPANNSTFLQMQVATSGSNFISGSYLCVASIINLGSYNSTTSFILTGNVNTAVVSSSTLYGVNGHIHFRNPSNSASRKSIEGLTTYLSATTTIATGTIGIAILGGFFDGNSNPITGVNFSFNAGNIQTGVIKIYGMT